MSNVPEGWKGRDVRDIVPAEAVKDVIAFCKGVLDHPYKHKSIGREAAEYLKRHETAFGKLDVVLRYFGYWLEHQFNEKKLAAVIAALERPVPKRKTLGEVLPPECVKRLEDFATRLVSGTFIYEPNVAVVTLLRERVLEPFREQILAPG